MFNDFSNIQSGGKVPWPYINRENAGKFNEQNIYILEGKYG